MLGNKFTVILAPKLNACRILTALKINQNLPFQLGRLFKQNVNGGRKMKHVAVEK
jgi:hypothetical protein